MQKKILAFSSSYEAKFPTFMKRTSKAPGSRATNFFFISAMLILGSLWTNKSLFGSKISLKSAFLRLKTAF